MLFCGLTRWDLRSCIKLFKFVGDDKANCGHIYIRVASIGSDGMLRPAAELPHGVPGGIDDAEFGLRRQAFAIHQPC